MVYLKITKGTYSGQTNGKSLSGKGSNRKFTAQDRSIALDKLVLHILTNINPLSIINFSDVKNFRITGRTAITHVPIYE
jgi:hypothetical protein